MQGRRKSASVIGKAEDLLKQSRRLSHVPTATAVGNKDGSELNAYLSQLSMKTSGTTSKKITAIDGLSDLSLTTDDEDDQQKQPAVQSRFVKKGLSQTLINTDSSEVPSKRRPTSGKLNKTLPSYSSSALEKAAAFSAKYKKKPAAKTMAPDDLTSSISETNKKNEIPKSKQRSPQPAGKNANKVANKYLQKTKVNTSTPKKKETKSAFHSVKTFSDSDDEMQAFIMNLSPVTSPDIPPIRRQQAQARVKDSFNKVKKNVESPFIANANKSIPEDKKDKKNVKEVSTKKEKAKQKISRKIEEELPSLSLASSIHTDDSDDTIEEIKTERSEPVINRFGLQTIDDLHLQTIDDLHLQTIDDLRLHTTDELHTIDDLRLHTIDDLKLQTIDDLHTPGLSPKKADSYASDFESEISTDKTISEIKTENSDSTQIQEEFVEDLYTKSFNESSSIKEKKSVSESSYIGTVRTSERSNHKAKEQDSYIYTEDFDSYSRKIGTDSEVEEIPRDSSRTEIYSQSYSSYSETRTLTPRKEKHRARAAGVDIGTQVDDAARIPGLDPSVGIGFMDPKLVTSHVITPDALEALTGYSPSVLAMNDLLRAQLIGTQTSIQHMHQVHQQLVQSISEDYQYTTLEQTRQYITKHRRSRLTLEDALKQVKEEMDEGHR